MNEILKDVIMIVSGLIGGYLLIFLKNKIFKQTVKEVEPFIPEKLKEGLTNITGKVSWAKTLTQELSIRTWIIRLTIIGLVIGVIFGYGWYIGTQGNPVHFDMRGKEATIQLNEHYLKIEKNGTANVVDKDGKILKSIRVKDIDGLRQALRPYGFELKPIGVIGGGIGEKGAAIEGGIGVSFFKWYLNNLEAFITNRGGYLGVSYRLEKIKLENTSIGIGVGKGYKGDNRVIIYGRVRF